MSWSAPAKSSTILSVRSTASSSGGRVGRGGCGWPAGGCPAGGWPAPAGAGRSSERDSKDNRDSRDDVRDTKNLLRSSGCRLAHLPRLVLLDGEAPGRVVFAQADAPVEGARIE